MSKCTAKCSAWRKRFLFWIVLSSWSLISGPRTVLTLKSIERAVRNRPLGSDHSVTGGFYFSCSIANTDWGVRHWHENLIYQRSRREVTICPSLFLQKTQQAHLSPHIQDQKDHENLENPFSFLCAFFLCLPGSSVLYG